MSREDFMVSTPTEFTAISNAHREESDIAYRDSWERMRMQAAISIMPYAGKKGVEPRKILPFPWDEKKKPKDDGLTPQERKAKMIEFAKKHNFPTI